jgi:hypothetical protein
LFILFEKIRLKYETKILFPSNRSCDNRKSQKDRLNMKLHFKLFQKFSGNLCDYCKKAPQNSTYSVKYNKCGGNIKKFPGCFEKLKHFKKI